MHNKSKAPADVKSIDISTTSDRNSINKDKNSKVSQMNEAVKSLYIQAQKLQHQQKSIQAITTLKRAYSIQSNVPQVCQFLAEIYLQVGDLKQAYYWADLATNNSPKNGDVCEKSWRLLAVATEHLGYSLQFQKAHEQIDSCLSVNTQRN